MNTQKVTKTYRLNKWAQLISECRSSGKKVSVWCKENNISTNSYFYWLRKIRAAACEALPALQAENNSFVPISFPPSQAKEKESTLVGSPAPSIIVKMGSLSMEIQNTATLELIENTLRALHHAR